MHVYMYIYIYIYTYIHTSENDSCNLITTISEAARGEALGPRYARGLRRTRQHMLHNC